MANLGGYRQSFYEYYQKEIGARLSAIDSEIKSNKSVDVWRMAELLGISTDELERIIIRKGILSIGRNNIHTIMTEAGGELSAYYRREVERGSPLVYTREDIAYIYNIDINRINRVCDSLGIIETTSMHLPEIFKRIRIKTAKH